VSRKDLYIPMIDLPILLQEYVDRSWDYINRSQTHECEKLGLRPRSFQKRNTQMGFSLQCTVQESYSRWSLGQLELHCRRVENDSALAKSASASAAPGQTDHDDNGASFTAPAPSPPGKGSRNQPVAARQLPAPHPQSGQEREVKGGQSGEQQSTAGGRPSAADFRNRRPGGRF
jgi:hypothetical protein